jgi:hypothetical protein
VHDVKAAKGTERLQRLARAPGAVGVHTDSVDGDRTLLATSAALLNLTSRSIINYAACFRLIISAD